MPQFDTYRDNLGGTYYTRFNLAVGEDARCVWFGFNPDRNYANVLIGAWRDATGPIAGRWVDVPLGAASRSGTLEVEVRSSPRRGRMRVLEQTGGFGATQWSEISSPVPLPEPLPRGDRSAPLDDLTGVWGSDTEGRYYIRQIGSSVYWFAGSAGAHATHVAWGSRDGADVQVSWLDIPPGRVRNPQGELRLHISDHGLMFKADSSRSFGDSRWVKLS